jgi:hypothetical protein
MAACAAVATWGLSPLVRETTRAVQRRFGVDQCLKKLSPPLAASQRVMLMSEAIAQVAREVDEEKDKDYSPVHGKHCDNPHSMER